jgi:ATP adenylyltransferase
MPPEESGPERLHAPWRMEYIVGTAGEPEDVCVFCNARDETSERERFIIHRGERCFIILNAYPYNNGHLMIIPYLHTAELEDLPIETLTEMMRMSTLVVAALRRVMSPHGFNLGMNLGRTAGAGIADHLHLHVVPRWNGDTNFMPVIGNVRVLPESLDKTWEKVRAAFAQVLAEDRAGSKEL